MEHCALGLGAAGDNGGTVQLGAQLRTPLSAVFLLVGQSHQGAKASSSSDHGVVNCFACQLLAQVVQGGIVCHGSDTHRRGDSDCSAVTF